MKTIAITNRKGGVGKSTTAAALAHGLSLRGHRVLCVDIDPQHNLTDILRAQPKEGAPTLAELLLRPRNARSAAKTEEADPADSVVSVPAEAAGCCGVLDILPAGDDLMNVEDELAGSGLASILRGLLRCLEADYDYCVIDTPPSVGLLTVNALTAARWALIPGMADSLSLQALVSLIDLVEAIRHTHNTDLSILGVLLTSFQSRVNLDAMAEERLAKIADSEGFARFRPIPQAVAVREAQLAQQSLLTYAPKSKAAEAYLDLVKTVESLTNQEQQ